MPVNFTKQNNDLRYAALRVPPHCYGINNRLLQMVKNGCGAAIAIRIAAGESL
jgi:hypothetical protein